MKTKNIAAFFAILAAALYAINIPISKILLEYVDSTMMAGFLYLGAGFGMIIYEGINYRFGQKAKKEFLSQKELLYTVAMIVLDIIAPIFFMFGISRTNSANVSLLNNFEIVATTLIAFLIFQEVISKRLWFAIGLVIIASIMLSFEGNETFSFHKGSLFILVACICWGLENNCTKIISNKSSEEIVIIKGCFSGVGSLIIALAFGENMPAVKWIAAVLLLGFISYGLSINFYIMAQKHLGAAKTSAYYSIAPFLGVIFGIIFLGERPNLYFYMALVIMLLSTYIMVKDTIQLQHNHQHEHTHTHEHSHAHKQLGVHNHKHLQ